MPEIELYSALSSAAAVCAFGREFRSGMLVSIPLFLDDLPGKPGASDLKRALAAHYAGSKYVRVSAAEEGGRIEPQSLNGTNDLELRVFANAARRQAC